MSAMIPSARDENWRYAPLRVVERRAWTPLEAPAASTVAAAEARAGETPSALVRLLLVDGHVVAALPTPAGVDLRVDATAATDTVATALHFDRSGDGRLAALNARHAPHTLRLGVAGGQRAAVELVHVASGATERAAHPRVAIDLAEGAALELLERHIGLPGAALVNAAMQVRLAARAELRHTRLSDPADGALLFTTLEVDAGRESRYALVDLALGGAGTRATTRVALSGEAASTELDCAALGNGQQTHDHFLLVEHTAPATRTREVYRGIAAGRSRLGFNGHVLVRNPARGAQSEQSLRTLLVDGQAEANVRPQLEIYTSDVRASHGATTGMLDQQMLFYLLSRGLDRAEAQALLKWAFIEEVVTRIAHPDLRRRAERLVAQRFSDVPLARELA